MHPTDIVNCVVTLSDTPIVHSSILCEHLIKDLVIGLDGQQIYNISCDLLTDSQMYLYQGEHVLINTLYIAPTQPKIQSS